MLRAFSVAIDRLMYRCHIACGWSVPRPVTYEAFKQRDEARHQLTCALEIPVCFLKSRT
jgi:hypothetical protein